MKRAITIIFLLALMGVTYSADRWYPTNFSASNLRLNVTYPVNSSSNYSYSCLVDIFPINDSTILSSSFSISGPGVSINTSQNTSIGAENPSDKGTWASQPFNVNNTGTLYCNVSIEDSYGSVETLTSNFTIYNEIPGCGYGPDCTVSTSTLLLPGNYRYRIINVTSSGILYNGLNTSTVSTYGSVYNLTADSDIYMAGTMLLNGSGNNAGYNAMYAGTLAVVTNGLFYQSGSITGNGVNGTTDGSGNSYAGGDSLAILVTADTWQQEGNLSLSAGNASSTTTVGKDGNGGGPASYIVFSGRSWNSTGAILLRAGNGGNGSGGNGGNGGSVSGIYCYGTANFSGTQQINVSGGNGGNSVCASNLGGQGGTGGWAIVFAYLEGSLNYTRSGTFSLSSGIGGGSQTCNGVSYNGGTGGPGIFLYENGTGFYWNSANYSFQLGNGGSATGAGSNGGDGGSWYNTGNSTYEGVTCRDYCGVFSFLNLTGGNGGTSGSASAGARGTNGSWEVQYNYTLPSNNFSKLGMSVTSYNLSATTGFKLASDPKAPTGLTLNGATQYALDNLSTAWTRGDSENISNVYYVLRLYGNSTGYSIYPFALAPGKKSPANTTSYVFDTNRLANGTWTVQVAMVSYLNRTSAWTSTGLTILIANQSVVGTMSSEQNGTATRIASCNVTGYTFNYSGSIYNQTNTTAPIYHGTVLVYVVNNGTNSSITTTYDSTNKIYNATVPYTLVNGSHSWYCVATKANYQNATYTGANFTVNNFSVVYPTGITAIRMVCPFPSILNIQPYGQSSVKPIFTIINHLSSVQNYSIGVNGTPVNASLYFNVVGNRLGQFNLSNTTNKTACINVPYANSTACRLWIYGDCINVPPGTYNTTFGLAEEK